MGTNINELIEDISNNKLSSEENSMVDSIINDLNNDDMRDRQRQQQQQQQMQQQQQQQQQNTESPSKEKNTFSELSFQGIFQQFKTTIVVFLLVVFFNLNPIDDFLRFKQFSIFYDIKDDKSTFLYAIVKSIVMTLLYYAITYLIK